MSSTAPTPSGDDHVSPGRAFDRLVWHNPRVCNGCFERTLEIQEATFSGGVSDHDVEDRHRTPQATIEPDERIVTTVDTDGKESERPGPQRSPIARTTCRTCARIGCWAEDSTLSKIAALRLATPLAKRLTEAGVEFDDSALREFIRLGKEGKYHSYDTEIFRCAVKTAMKRA